MAFCMFYVTWLNHNISQLCKAAQKRMRVRLVGVSGFHYFVSQ